MMRVIVIVILATLTLSACTGVIDRDPSGLYDPGTHDITHHHHD